MATDLMSRLRKDGTGRPGMIVPRSPASGTEKKQKNEDEDPEKILRRQQVRTKLDRCITFAFCGLYCVQSATAITGGGRMKYCKLYNFI